MPEDTRSERTGRDSVSVFVNDEQVEVPRVVHSHWEARGVLGVPRGLAVSYEFACDPLAFEGGHEFHDGDRYEILDFQIWVDLQQEDEEDTEESWQQDPSWWKH